MCHSSYFSNISQPVRHKDRRGRTSSGPSGCAAGSQTFLPTVCEQSLPPHSWCDGRTGKWWGICKYRPQSFPNE